MRPKKLYFFCLLSLELLLLLAGCSETDSNFVESENNITESGMESESIIIENVNPSQIASPDEATIYRTELWEKSHEEIFDIMLQGNVLEKTSWAGGPSYCTDSLNEIIGIFDGGLDFYGEYKDEYGKNGFSYSYKYDSLELQELFQVNIGEEYNFKWHQKEMEPQIEEKEEVQKTIELTETYIEQLQFPAYALQGAAFELIKGKETWTCILVLRQIVDEIPFSSLIMEKGQSEKHYIYNNTLSYNLDMRQFNSTLVVQVVDGELVYWYANDIVNIVESLDSYPIITAEEAYQTIQDYYYQQGDTTTNPRLNVVELQYKSLEIDDKGILFPVWMFVIVEDEQFLDYITNEIKSAEVWHYYFINAITGEFFVDVNVE